MNWIGQNIYDLVARFRNDVHLEDISTGTIASGGNLGLDSNNKIVKATVSGGGVSGNTFATDLKIGRDADNLIDFTTDNNIVIRANGEDQLTLVDGALTPTTNAIVDLGTDALEFKDGYFDGTLEADAITIGGTAIASVLSPVAGHASIATVGTITSGVWNGTAINQTYLTGQSGTNTGDETLSSINSLSVTTVGTIDTGVWNGTAVASAYLDADTAHLSGTQTFSGAKTFSAAEGIVINDATTSSATEGGSIVLASDDGAAMADNHRLGVVEFKGAEDASNTLTIGARIQAICDAAWSATENGASLEFYTTDGNASESVALTLDSNNLATFPGTVEVNNLTVGSAQGNDGQVLTSTGSGVAWEDASGGGSLSGDNFATDLKIGRDAHNLIDFTTDDEITFRVGDADGVVMKASGEIEATSLDISGAIAMNSDQKLSFGHASTFIEGMTSGSKMGLYGQTDILLRINNSTVIVMDNAKCEFSIPAIPATSDGVALGSATKMWSDLFLASGSVINLDNGDVTLTHSANTLTIGGGDLDTNRKLNVTSSTHFEAKGDIVYIGSGTTTQGELCYLTSGGAWAATDADAVATSGGVLLGLALGTDPDADGMLLRGMFTLDHDPGTIADELYISTTAGDITATAPSGSGDIVRVIGYCMDSTNGQIWFNPSNDFIVLA